MALTAVERNGLRREIDRAKRERMRIAPREFDVADEVVQLLRGSGRWWNSQEISAALDVDGRRVSVILPKLAKAGRIEKGDAFRLSSGQRSTMWRARRS